MPLPVGTWRAVVNGAEGELRIDAPDAQGVFEGQIHQRRLKGYWNEQAQAIRFTVYTSRGAAASAVAFGFFQGLLFQVPLHAEPGKDVTHTLVGSLDATPQIEEAGLSEPFPGTVPTSRRSTFGWLATLIEVR